MLIGEGRKTVDQAGIKERFHDLGITVDWKPLDRLTNYRNAIEHYRLSESKDELRAAIAGTAKIIRHLIVDVLGAEPVEALRRPCWEALLETKTLFEEELARCRATLAAINWYSTSISEGLDEVACPDCSSNLIAQRDGANTSQQDADFVCRSCGASLSNEALIENALGQILYADFYIAMTDGGEEPVAECDACGHETYILAEELCAACGHHVVHRACPDCGNFVRPDDDAGEGSRCAACDYAASMAHDDR